MASFSEQLSPLEWGPLSNARFIDLLAQFSNSKIAILVDENTHDHCLEYLITGFEALATAEVIMLPAGEENKVLEVCFQVWETLTEAGFGRHDLLLNLGGGVVTDLGGFVASVYKRGFAFVHIPTSLLGMVDAAVGGKTGIDLAGYKNQLGTFQEPLATFVDTGFLQTLPDTEWRNGFAELLKHALIADKTLWEALTQIKNIPLELRTETIQQGVQIKVDIVAQDPTEQGLRKILNFGHTIGHALESYYLNSDTPLAHGHAVAIGMLLEAQLSVDQANLSQTEFEAIEKCIKQTYPIQIPNDAEGLWTLMQQDKKNANGEVRICLLPQIGSCLFDQKLTFTDFQHALQDFIA
ncbi:MAG: 3-dehydroquinate synthase [Crocinitomicaceae bacterium]|nr:3-dehydroquinate synthase [Crocinitomicaceae bacterium]MDP4724335.1 3-dehydroquinate synthase [Crocinitomicaceae bacterium]MDP4739460.1 3-dehydroquinate synthase [Crocinitomicaceae bacterium]MDP5041943.1 3-dehydroquinate synthase [Crocinitomicaceae bacterium]